MHYPPPRERFGVNDFCLYLLPCGEGMTRSLFALICLGLSMNCLAEEYSGPMTKQATKWGITNCIGDIKAIDKYQLQEVSGNESVGKATLAPFCLIKGG